MKPSSTQIHVAAIHVSAALKRWRSERYSAMQVFAEMSSRVSKAQLAPGVGGAIIASPPLAQAIQNRLSSMDVEEWMWQQNAAVVMSGGAGASMYGNDVEFFYRQCMTAADVSLDIDKSIQQSMQFMTDQMNSRVAPQQFADALVSSGHHAWLSDAFQRLTKEQRQTIVQQLRDRKLLDALMKDERLDAMVSGLTDVRSDVQRGLRLIGGLEDDLRTAQGWTTNTTPEDASASLARLKEQLPVVLLTEREAIAKAVGPHRRRAKDLIADINRLGLQEPAGRHNMAFLNSLNEGAWPSESTPVIDPWLLQEMGVQTALRSFLGRTTGLEVVQAQLTTALANAREVWSAADDADLIAFIGRDPKRADDVRLATIATGAPLETLGISLPAEHVLLDNGDEVQRVRDRIEYALYPNHLERRSARNGIKSVVDVLQRDGEVAVQVLEEDFAIPFGVALSMSFQLRRECARIPELSAIAALANQDAGLV